MITNLLQTTHILVKIVHNVSVIVDKYDDCHDGTIQIIDI